MNEAVFQYRWIPLPRLCLPLAVSRDEKTARKYFRWKNWPSEIARTSHTFGGKLRKCIRFECLSWDGVQGDYAGNAIRDELWKRTNGRIYLTTSKALSMLGEVFGWSITDQLANGRRIKDLSCSPGGTVHQPEVPFFHKSTIFGQLCQSDFTLKHWKKLGVTIQQASPIRSFDDTPFCVDLFQLGSGIDLFFLKVLKAISEGGLHDYARLGHWVVCQEESNRTGLFDQLRSMKTFTSPEEFNPAMVHALLKHG